MEHSIEIFDVELLGWLFSSLSCLFHPPGINLICYVCGHDQHDEKAESEEALIDGYLSRSLNLQARKHPDVGKQGRSGRDGKDSEVRNLLELTSWDGINRHC